MPLTALGIVIGSVIVMSVMRFEHKAVYSGELYRQIGRLSADWQYLWADQEKHDDAELRDAWRNLSQRQQAIVERAPVELPLSNGLLRRSRREADEYSSARREGEAHGDATG